MNIAVDAGGSAPANEAAISNAGISVDGAAPAQVINPNTEPATETKTPSMDETMQGIWEKHNPRRDPSTGKFLARDGATEPTTETPPTETTNSAGQAAETPAPEQTAAQTSAPAIDAPLSWSAEQKAKWASVPPDLQAYIAQRDKEQHEAISRAGQQVKAYEPVGNVIEQFREIFERNQLPPHEGIARMLAVEQWLARDPGAAISEIAKAYKVDLRGLNGDQPAPPANGQEGTQAAVDPRVSTLENAIAERDRRIERIESFLTAQQRQQYQQSESALARQIADFENEQKDGKPLRPHFGAVYDEMTALIPGIRAKEPGLSIQEVLAKAYDKAVHANPDIRARILADQRSQDEDKRRKETAQKAEAARKAASVNVRSGPTGGASPKSMDDTLNEIARKAYGT